jgi:hypothetical protein
VTALKLYSEVRIHQLLRGDDDAYDDWGVNRRRPRLGDVGTLVEILQAPGAQDRYVVECSMADGNTEWLSDFVADELSPLDA